MDKKDFIQNVFKSFSKTGLRIKNVELKENFAEKAKEAYTKRKTFEYEMKIQTEKGNVAITVYDEEEWKKDQRTPESYVWVLKGSYSGVKIKSENKELQKKIEGFLMGYSDIHSILFEGFEKYKGLDEFYKENV